MDIFIGVSALVAFYITITEKGRDFWTPKPDFDYELEERVVKKDEEGSIGLKIRNTGKTFATDVEVFVDVSDTDRKGEIISSSKNRDSCIGTIPLDRCGVYSIPVYGLGKGDFEVDIYVTCAEKVSKHLKKSLPSEIVESDD